MLKLIVLSCLIASSLQQEDIQQQLTSLDGAETASDSDPESANEIKEPTANRMMPYSFAYDTGLTSGLQLTRKESGDESGVRGSYSYIDAEGLFRTVEYVADKDGFRAVIKTNEPGLNDAEKPRPAAVTIHGEESPAVVMDRMHGRSPPTTQSPPTPGPSPAPLPSQASFQSRTQKVPASQFVLFEPQRSNLRNLAEQNPGARMFRLIPMASGEGKTAPRASNLVLLLPEQDFEEPVQQQQQQQEETVEDQEIDEKVVKLPDVPSTTSTTTSTTTTTTTTTTPRPTTRVLTKTAPRIPRLPTKTVQRATKTAPVKSLPQFPTKTSPAQDFPVKSARQPQIVTRPALSIVRSRPTTARPPVKSQTSIQEQASSLLNAILSPARTLRTGNLKNV